MQKNINVRPSITIWSRLRENTYNLSDVILEFIDNSISSYEQNYQLLHQQIENYSLKIYVIYDQKNEILTVWDNAFGMDLEELSKAVQPESKTRKGPLNKHGMGMKNAAVWLGDRLEIESSQLGNDKRVQSFHYFDKYIDGKEENAIVNDWKSADVNQCFTRITVSKILAKRTITQKKLEKLIKAIAYTYNHRLDKNVEIKVSLKLDDSQFKDLLKKVKTRFKICNKIEEVTSVTFVEENIAHRDDGTQYRWEWNDEIESKIQPKGIKLKFKGFIAINKSVRSEPGIYCAVDQRVIQLYPIDKLSNTTPHRKIFGRFNFESGVGTVQTKNQIDWEVDFEELFNEKLILFIKKHKITETAFKLTKEVKTTNLASNFIKWFNKSNTVTDGELDYERPYLSSNGKKIIFEIKDSSDILEIEINDQQNPDKIFNVTQLPDHYWAFTLYFGHIFFKKLGATKSTKALDLVNIFVGIFLSIYQTTGNKNKLLLSIFKNLHQYFERQFKTKNNSNNKNGSEKKDIQGKVSELQDENDISNGRTELGKKENQKKKIDQQIIDVNQKINWKLVKLQTVLKAKEEKIIFELLNSSKDERLQERYKSIIIKCNQKLVANISSAYKGRGLKFEDLMTEGNVGLLKAIDKFNYRLGYKFSTYATWWIKQTITRAIADQGRIIRIPVHMIETINKIIAAEKFLIKKNRVLPTNKEIAQQAKLNLSSDKIDKIKKYSQRTENLEKINEEKRTNIQQEAEFGDFIEDKRIMSPDKEIDHRDLIQKTDDIIRLRLTTREQRVIRMRLGKPPLKLRHLIDLVENKNKKKEMERFAIINGIDLQENLENVVNSKEFQSCALLVEELKKYQTIHKTLEKTGETLKLTKERVRQIEIKAYRKLRMQRKVLSGYGRRNEKKPFRL